MKLLSPTIILSALLTLFACGNEIEQDTPTTIPAEPETSPVFEYSEEFLDQLEVAMDSYFQLSAALVDSNPEDAADQSVILVNNLDLVPTINLDDQARNDFDDYYQVISSRASEINLADDIEEQRYHFEYLSEAAIDLVERFGPLEYTVYVQRCPMVRDGSADWLSRHEDILNPYHGDRMLRCGSIVREL